MEIWKAIVGYEGRYEVSDMGRVRSLDRFVGGRHGRRRRFPGRVLTPTPTAKGYLHVSLSAEAAGVKQRYVHHLVLEAFDGPMPSGEETCHNNGRPGDNRRVNLRYDTPAGNCADKKIHGTYHRGPTHPSYKHGKYANA